MEKLVNKEFLEHSFRGKKVFVTGHTGFKGSWLCAWLHELKAEVKGYALAPEQELCLFNIMKPLNLNESIIADIRNKQLLISEIQNFQPDFIFHLAAQPLVRRSYKIPAETFEINVAGTANLLEAVTTLPNKCTVVIVTTDKVYENKESEILYNENDILGGYDPYSASKACTELVTNSFRSSFFNPNNYNTHLKSISSARAGNVIGGGDYSEDRIIPDIVKALYSEKNIIIRNPASVRPWQHVLEPLGGYLLLAARCNDEENLSGAYNFGPGPEGHLTVQQIADIAIQQWGSGKWEHLEMKSVHEAQLLKLDVSKAKNILHWVPKLNAADTIKWTLEWYKNKKQQVEITFDQIKKYMAL